jgi:hypothetical protein
MVAESVPGTIALSVPSALLTNAKGQGMGPVGEKCRLLFHTPRAVTRIFPRMKTLLFSTLLILTGCSTLPPKNPSNICSIFREKADWYEAALDAQKNWGVPVPVQMAIMKQESAFVDDARPPRNWFLGIIPLSRPTTAYGYSQATDATWQRYLDSTGHRGADRDDFADAVDFIGWYTQQTRHELGIPKTDAYRQYLAYHEGQTGYRKGRHQEKPWLLGIARNVQSNAARYDRQLASCSAELADGLDQD